MWWNGRGEDGSALSTMGTQTVSRFTHFGSAIGAYTRLRKNRTSALTVEAICGVMTMNEVKCKVCRFCEFDYVFRELWCKKRHQYKDDDDSCDEGEPNETDLQDLHSL